MKEEVKSLGALAKMTRMSEMNKLQQDAQRLQEKEVKLNKMIQPYIEQRSELAKKVQKKVKEFNTTESVVYSTEDAMVTKVMLEVAQQCIETIDSYVVSLKDEFLKTSQEAKEKLQKKKPTISGSGTSQK